MDDVDVGESCEILLPGFSSRFFTAMTGNKVEKKNQSSSMYFYAMI